MFGVGCAQSPQPACAVEDEGFHDWQAGAHQSGERLSGGKDDIKITRVRWIEVVVRVEEE